MIRNRLNCETNLNLINSFASGILQFRKETKKNRKSIRVCFYRENNDVIFNLADKN